MPHTARRERPGRPRERIPAGPQRPPGSARSASVRRFHLEGAARNCTRGTGPARLGAAQPRPRQQDGAPNPTDWMAGLSGS